LVFLWHHFDTLCTSKEENPQNCPFPLLFLPIDNALYSIAFGTHTKKAELIEMPIGMMSGLARGTVCYVGVMILEGEGAILGKTSARQA